MNQYGIRPVLYHYSLIVGICYSLLEILNAAILVCVGICWPLNMNFIIVMLAAVLSQNEVHISWRRSSPECSYLPEYSL